MSATEIKVPAIGDFKSVPVIEVHVKAGDAIKADDPLITLESDKAAMEVPAPRAGVVAELLLKVGDKVSEGTAILRLETAGVKSAAAVPAAVSMAAPEAPDLQTGATPASTTSEAKGEATMRRFPPPAGPDFANVHASPSVRRLARDLDIDLTQIAGTGEHGRVTKEDVRRALADQGGKANAIPEIPTQDFAKFGLVEVRPLTRLKRLSGPHLHRAWLNVPHVTHTDDADITGLEEFRRTLDAAAKEKGYRVTLLAFLMKASVVALKEYPEFNSSLAPGQDSLVFKSYYNIGVAVDTPDGLVVPVVRDVDRKGIAEISQELSVVSKRMRDGKIAPADIQGGTFSISSLGGIGGTSFTPIVNAPEVAILGVVRAAMKPHWNGAAFEARLTLPLCLSYDHRVIDGALAARFTRRLADILQDVRQLVL